MTPQDIDVPQTPYRNFSLCLHCVNAGQQALPYPLAREAGPSSKISVCFWYPHLRRPKYTFSSMVILEGSRTNNPSVFRRIELIADLLANKLAREGSLIDVYEFVESPGRVAVC